MISRLRKFTYRIAGVMALGLCAPLTFQACSGKAESSGAPGTTDANLADSSSSASPSASTGSSANTDLDCRNPSRSFQCSGEGCCAEEPTCAEGFLPFSDVCGCGCLAASCQPGNRNYTTTSPHECSSGTRPQCQPETEAPFDDECGCGCTDLVNLPEGCDPNWSYVCKGYGCCVGANPAPCAAGMQGFEDQCGCGCKGVSACAQPDRAYICRGQDCCAGFDFGCPAGEQVFSDGCGCGCAGADACGKPNRTFICRGPDCCIGIDFPCPEGTRGFDDACGCGCEP